MRYKDRLESYLISVVNNNTGGASADIVRGFLTVLSHIYNVAVGIRLFLYKHHLLKASRLGCLVISVGNITVGGTGKTPVVEMVAKTLSKTGRKTAILSRGYKSIYKKRNNRNGNKNYPRIVSDGNKVVLNAKQSGDEPFMLAKEIPEAAVLVDKNRVKAARFAVNEFGADTLILDDGYQYMPLARQVNIVLIDCTNPFGNHRVLPRGFLREPIRNLNRANMIFLTKGEGMDLYALKKTLNKLNPDAELIECAHRPKYLNDIYSRTKRDLKWLMGRKIACVSGIASPRGFEEALRGLGAHLVGCYRFPDHHLYNKREIQEIIEFAKKQNVEGLVTTQKDAVRFPKIDYSKDFPLYFLKVEIEMLKGGKEFYDKLEKIS